MSFRVGRGCLGAVFGTLQVLENAYEHHGKLFSIFIDLRKAYDPVPRAALWITLAHLGVHPDLVNLIKSSHEDMVVTVRVAGGCSEPIQVLNSLWQGCVMAPVLFNLYVAVVLGTFLELLSRLHLESGVRLHVIINWNLIPPSTRYSRIPNDRTSDLEYTDDTMIL